MQHAVAFTPKGGCPLKLYSRRGYRFVALLVAFTPKGGCPLKPDGDGITATERFRSRVAFTPKGGCPLKRICHQATPQSNATHRSIHPQGWVPIETSSGRRHRQVLLWYRSIHPQGWVLTGVQGFSAGFQPLARFSQQGGRTNRRSPLHPATTGGRGRTSSATTRAPWSLGQDSSRTAPATPSLCSRPCAARPESTRSRSRHSQARAGWSR